MLYYFFALLAAAIVLLVNDIRNAANRWAAFFLVFAAIGGLADTAADMGWSIAARGIELLNLTVTPYGVLMFAMTYSGLPNRRRKPYSLLRWLLLLPVFAMLAAGLAMPGLPIRYGWLLLWSGPYYVISCILLVLALWREKDTRKRRQRLVTTLLFVPTLLAVLMFIYVARTFAPDFPFFGYVAAFISYSLAAGLLLAFAYGVLGVRLRFERDPLESAMKAASSGTNLLNHTIKNEIGKIAISADNARRSLPPGVDEEVQQHLAIIERSSEHMRAMVERLHGRTKAIELREEPVRLDLLASSVTEDYSERAERAQVIVEIHCRCAPTVVCDPVHVREALGNLLANAIEASPSPGGRVEVALNASKRNVTLSVGDNGPGMTRSQTARAFEPFYSTKNGSNNYGLGLSYVYNVMHAHGGSAELSGKESGGVTASLVFPRKKVLRQNGGG
ncbi:HAMP domain-containing sensor histidine kinase [Paenibacillus sp. PAMC21692]|uniref:sensor histidine kinase n=1 Tax=Paenibacillus sp. PAMC21692 TaxID=2762320 RepID=UPI00164E9909|nr:HAMP domain-containing sensor histidine kinase [Paenibacillus sp. PAMC21692]QNK58708.1 HAMP domain-containing histidine kinase [Paenibacillus sp. PAMC21692]